MLNVGIKCAVYAALVEWGACERAKAVFDDDFIPSSGAYKWVAAGMAREIEHIVIMFAPCLKRSHRREVFARLVLFAVESEARQGSVAASNLLLRFGTLWDEDIELPF